MTKKLYPEESVSDIAAAIREKNGLSTTYNISEMGPAIRDIPTSSTSGDRIKHGDIPDYIKDAALALAKKVKEKQKINYCYENKASNEILFIKLE